MTDLPVCTQSIHGLLPPVTAIAVAVIAFFQWRTAHQKVVLDLFERRMAVYRGARSAVSMIISTGTVTRESETVLLEAMDSASFLFDEDVHQYLLGHWRTVIQLRELANKDDEFVKRDALIISLRDFYVGGALVFRPYMRMDNRNIRTFSQWLKDRNRSRLSYGDKN